MPLYGIEPESNGRRRDVAFAAVVVLLALATPYLSEPAQRAVSNVVQGSVLRPFIALQQTLSEARRRAGQVDHLTGRLDSLTAVLATHQALADENRTLRALLDLAERGGPSFVPATVLRPGTPGSQGMFIVDVGTVDGVPEGAPVLAPHGLVGVIHEVRGRTAVGLDWSYPDFRASAVLVDGTTYGIVERRRGRYQEDDRLILSGTRYSANVRPGTVVMTSGLGRLPRGIPIGKTDYVLESEGAWRRSFWIKPMVEPGAATHVLVLTDGSDEAISGAWPVDSLQSLRTHEESLTSDELRPGGLPGSDLLRPLQDRSEGRGGPPPRNPGS